MANKVSNHVARLIEGNSTDNPKIYPQLLADGQVSLYLLYYFGKESYTDPKTGRQTSKKIRQKKTMKLFLYDNPRTPVEREHNRQTAEIARKVRYEAEQVMKQRETGYRIPKEETDFLMFYRHYIDAYQKKDIRDVKIAYKRFTDFLADTPKYNAYCTGIRPCQITKDMILEFTEYLKTRSVGEGANTIYARFKKVVKYGVEHEVFAKNPCEGITIKVDKNGIKKDVLSMDEIRILAATPFQGNQNIRRAFLFSVYTGLRWCDVRELTFSNVDYSNRLLKFTQSKTEGHSAHADVTIPLTNSTLSLIGEKGEAEDKVFVLPSYELSCRYVKMWVKRAGIDKHISWHCARHTFAVNVLSNGADIQTVSSLLGHSSIAMTAKYLHVVDSLKRKAVDTLPELNF